MKRPNKTTYLRWGGYIVIVAAVFMLGTRYGARTDSTSGLNARSVNMLAGNDTDAYRAAQAASERPKDRRSDTSPPRSSGIVTFTGKVVSVNKEDRSMVLGTESGRELVLSVAADVAVSKAVATEGSKIPKATKVTLGDVQKGDTVRLMVTTYGDGSFLVKNIRISPESSD